MSQLSGTADSITSDTSDGLNLTGTVRRLWPAEVALFRDHLLRLDEDSRHMRFAHGVSDSFITEYAGRMTAPGTLVYAYVDDGFVRAAGELKRHGALAGASAEVAVSIEQEYQNNGIGTQLLGRLIRSARNRGVRYITLICLSENERMQAIARKHDAGLHIERGEVTGEIVAAGSTYISLLEEAADDRRAMVMGFFDMQNRIQKLGFNAIATATAEPQSPPY